jgi:3-hydroxyacyl-[acyl-carrier-protein] dehydratase
LVDRVVECTPPESIHAFKNVSVNEPFFNGHFPGHPVMPGVLLVEALAQTGAILTYISVQSTPKETLFYLASMDNVKFKRKVIPGDQVHLYVKLGSCKGAFRKFTGEAFVDNQLVCSVEILGVMSSITQ